MRQRQIALVLLLVAFGLAPLWVRVIHSPPAAKASDFLVIGWGQPNTSEHIGELAKYFRNVEVDLMLDRGGVLVGAHDLEKLAHVHDGTQSNPLTLPTLLSMPFENVFLDMKDTLFERSPGVGPPSAEAAEHAERAVSLAFEAIAASGRSENVFVMAYWISDAMVAQSRARGARLMLQGYPQNDSESIEIVHTASRYGLSHVCIPLGRLTDPVLEESRRAGISHIPYTFFEEDWNKATYRRLFEEHLAGLILPPGSEQRRFVALLQED
jgi:hypothetical protein